MRTYLTLPYLRGGQVSSCPALRPYQFGPMCNPDVTIGHNSHLVVLTNRKRDIGFIFLSSSRLRRCDPKMKNLSCILAGHLPRKWNAVSSSSRHAAHIGSWHSFITLKCLLNAVRTLSSRQFNPRADRVSSLSGPLISILACLHAGCLPVHKVLFICPFTDFSSDCKCRDSNCRFRAHKF